ncbi:MAG: ribosomal protein S18-alanine N-acetyltransferase [Lachnospiraceae bacterium]
MIFVTQMQEADTEEVSRIEAECFSQPWSKKGFSEALRQESIFLVARDENQIVGYCGMYCSFGEGEITNVAVKSSHRGGHVATALMQQLFEKAEEKKMERILLEVRVSNVAALQLYKKMGFQTLCTKKDFYAFPKEDAFLMEKSFLTEA